MSLFSRWGICVPVYQGVVTLFVVLNFSLATFMDPGVIPKGGLLCHDMYFQNEWIVSSFSFLFQSCHCCWITGYLYDVIFAACIFVAFSIYPWLMSWNHLLISLNLPFMEWGLCTQLQQSLLMVVVVDVQYTICWKESWRGHLLYIKLHVMVCASFHRWGPRWRL